MRTLPPTAQLYIWTLASGALLSLWVALDRLTFDVSQLLPLTLFALLSVGAGLFPVVMPRRLIEITVGVAVNIAAVPLFPFSLAVLIPGIGALATELNQRRAWYKSLFNISHTVVTYAVLDLLVTMVYQGTPLLADGGRDALVLVVVGLAYYMLNTTLVILIVALTSGLPFSYVWRTNFRNIAWHQVSMVCTAFVLAFLWTVQPWSIVLIVLPIGILRRSIEVAAQLETQTYEAVEALADAIDSRDPSTHQHSERVTQYARAIATALDLGRNEVERIAISARLHDLGKVGVSDAWLYKQGPLTEEERQAFQSHASIGATIVARFSSLGAESDQVRSHHEHWDGGGYPDGLAGPTIPLGARIIAIADAFDAMTSDRPYRRALSYVEARRRLRACTGSQFDPRLVEVALRVLPGLHEEARQLALSSSEASPPAAALGATVIPLVDKQP